MFARPFIDSLDFARNGMELRGEVPVAEMSRLQDVLASLEGQVGYVLRGLPNKNGKSMLELELEGSCQLLCQRCLQGMPYQIRAVSHLVPVPENELPESGELEDEDEMDYVPATSHMDVLDLIEEEILLGLPFAPRHEPGTCQAAMKYSSGTKENPFAILRGMKNE